MEKGQYSEGSRGITQGRVARAYGSGSFKKRTSKANGKTVWQGFVRASDGRKVYASGKTQTAAEKAANTKRDDYERSLQAPAPTAATVAPPLEVPTFGEWLDEYNAHKRRQGRRDATLGKYRDYASEWSQIDPDDGEGPLGSRPLPAVTITELEVGIAFLHKRHGKQGQNTVRNKQAYVAGAIKRAWYLGKTEKPWGAALDPITRVQKGALELDDDGFGALCRLATAHPWLLAALILGRFGLRIGEVCGVTADDLCGNVLTVRRQLDRVATDGEHGPKDAPRPKAGRVPKGTTTLALCPLKSDAAERKVTLTDLEAGILMSALDSAVPDTVWDAVDGRWRTVLFASHAPIGRAHETQRLRDRWRELVKSAGLPPTDFHDLRALFASALADGGGEGGDAPTPIKAISLALGHTSTQITEIYLRGVRKAPTAAWASTSRAVAAALAP